MTLKRVKRPYLSRQIHRSNYEQFNGAWGMMINGVFHPLYSSDCGRQDSQQVRREFFELQAIGYSRALEEGRQWSIL